jgi:hypothetical protein
MGLEKMATPLLSVTTAGALTIVVGLTASTSAIEKSSSNGDGPQMVSGIVLDTRGHPVADAGIGVYVEQELPDADKLTLIAEGHTTRAGRFSIRGGVQGAPFTTNPDDSVTLQINVNDGIDVTHFDIDVRPPAPSKGRPDWTWGEVVDSHYLPRAAAPRAQERTGDVVAGLELQLAGEPTEGVTPPEGEAPTHESPNGIEPDIALMKHDATWCNTQYWRWLPDTSRFRSTPNMHVYQYNRTGMNYKWSTTRQTKLQIAYTGEGTVKGVGYKGGLSYTTEKDTTNWIDASWPRKAEGRNLVLKTEWRYQKQKLMCETSMSGTGQEGGYDTGHRRFKARTWTLGNRDVPTNLFWSCPSENRTVIDHKVGIDNGKTNRWNEWFEIVGVKLDATQTNTTKTVLSIWPAGGFNRAKICGKGAKPGSAALVREYPW